MQRRPTLLDSCARAATAAEARFRVAYPNSLQRASLVIALDDGAETVVRAAAQHDWAGARFLTYVEPVSAVGAGPGGAIVRGEDGSESLLGDELGDADVVVMIATSERSAEAASIIGTASFARGIMTAGCVFGAGDAADSGVVTALRPYASVLVVAADDDYVMEMLTALRA